VQRELLQKNSLLPTGISSVRGRALMKLSSRRTVRVVFFSADVNATLRLWGKNFRQGVPCRSFVRLSVT